MKARRAAVFVAAKATHSPTSCPPMRKLSRRANAKTCVTGDVAANVRRWTSLSKDVVGSTCLPSRPMYPFHSASLNPEL